MEENYLKAKSYQIGSRIVFFDYCFHYFWSITSTTKQHDIWKVTFFTIPGELEKISRGHLVQSPGQKPLLLLVV